VHCVNDRTIPLALQKELSKKIPDGDKYEINSGHSPFFSKPAELALLLEKIASKIHDE
jgi:hypothetical protein